MPRTIGWGGAGLVIAAVAATPAAAQSLKVGETKALGLPATVSATSSVTVQEPGATFIKLQLSNVRLPDGASLVIRNPYTGDSTTISTADVVGGVAWSHAVDGDTAVVEAAGGPSGAQASFTVAQYAYGTAPLSGPESVFAPDDRKDRECFPGTYIYHSSRSVGRMLYVDDNGGSFVCTGSLISPSNHFISNDHCANSEREVDSLEVRFNYEYTTCGGSTTKTYDTYGSAANDLITANSGLDFALMTLAGNPAAKYGYLPLNGENLQASTNPSDRDPLFLPQHPGGRQKVIHARHDGVTDQDCVVKKGDWSEPGYTAAASIQHTCDTEGGSSGSPVLNDAGQIVALHHTGYAGSPSLCSQGGGAGAPCNGAIEMENILPLIQGSLPAAQGGNGSSGWQWYRVREAWRYNSGNSERIWLYFSCILTSTDVCASTGHYAWVDVGQKPALGDMLIAGAESGNWLGLYWSSSSVWSNARLWYN